MVEFVIFVFWFLTGFSPTVIIILYVTKKLTTSNLITTIFGAIMLGPILPLITGARLNPNLDEPLIKKD